MPLINLLALFPLFPRRVLDGCSNVCSPFGIVYSVETAEAKDLRRSEKQKKKSTVALQGGGKKTQRSRCPLVRKQGKLPPRRILRFVLEYTVVTFVLSDVNFGLLR